MESYDNLKLKLSEINNDLSELTQKGTSIPGATKSVLSEWTRSCRKLQRQLAEETLRIGVVGTIKSGKSTFMNSLLGGDYLKRGAGVVTSIVTRIHHGPHPAARLFFKSWGEINQDITQALRLMPLAQKYLANDQFDIRDTKSRETIKELLDSLPVDQLVTNGNRNLNTVLVANYLNGYGRVVDVVAEKNIVKKFENDQFFDHWQYVGDDSLAVYLKDMQLELNSSSIDSDIELADCQGSDSPNPLHMAMIQDYLQEAHLIIYVVSSRTGLREADIKFLSIIRKMGLSSTVLLVINADISEHDSLSDLHKLVEQITSELALLIPEPQYYTFSTLLHLFDSLEGRLTEKDRMRLTQWNQQTELADFSKTEYQRFQQHLRVRIIRKRYHMMLKNQIERHDIILAGMTDWIAINRELLSRDDGDISKIVNGIKKQQERLIQIKTGIESTATGAMSKINKELNQDVNHFFDNVSGPYISQLISFIRDYSVDFGKYQEKLETDGFLITMSFIFQEFKQALDSVMTQKIYPEIVNFAKGVEEKIAKQLKATLDPYGCIAEQGLLDLRRELNWLGTNDSVDNCLHLFDMPDFDAIKTAVGLRLPPLVPMLEYTKRIQAEAYINAGYFSVLEMFRKIFKNRSVGRLNNSVKTLQRSVRHMKKQTEESILFEIKNYRENLKFAYLHRLVEEVTQRFADNLLDRFRSFDSGTVEMSNHASQLKSNKDRAIETVIEMERIAALISEKMKRLRFQVEHSEA
jgi:GTPase SAR1 family protein